MASNKTFNFGPAFIAATATNIFNTAVSSLAGPTGFTLTQPRAIIRHIRIVNKDSSARTFTLYKGATGGSTAGTEVVGAGVSIAANSYLDWYGLMEFTNTDFLVGIASVVSTLTIQGEGEIGF